MVAFGADIEIVLDLAGVKGLAAMGAFLPQPVELRLVEPLVVDGNGLEFIAPVKESAHGWFWSLPWPRFRMKVKVRRCACERPPRDADANLWRIRQAGVIGKRR